MDGKDNDLLNEIVENDIKKDEDMIIEEEKKGQEETQPLTIDENVKEDKKEEDSTALKYNPFRRKNFSKYDFIKVRVILEDHHYIFSRFLTSNILTLIKIPQKDSIKITLTLKKFLVESSKLEIKQAELEIYLFKIMNSYGYDESFVNRYKMFSKFYQKRVPLVILIAGTACMGKSTLVTQLAERINVSNVLQTKIAYEVMKCIDPDFNVSNYYLNEEINDEEFITLYNKECRLARKGVNFDLQKCFMDGKPLIIEGHHVNPIYYTVLDEDCAKDELDKSEKLKIFTPPAVDNNELISENDAIKEMRKQMKKINQKGAIVIPFLLTIDIDSHYLCIENRLSQEHLQNQKYQHFVHKTSKNEGKRDKLK